MLSLRAHRGAASSPAALRATQAFDYISKQCIPPGERGEGLGLRGSPMAALALEHQHVLPEVVGQLHNGERWARRDHPTIVASVGCGRPSSWKRLPILYEHLALRRDKLLGPTKLNEFRLR